MCRAFASLIASLAIYVPALHAEGWTPPPPVIKTIPAAMETLRLVRDYPGTFTSLNDVVIRAEGAGIVDVIHFKEGTRVPKGTLLITLKNKEQNANVDKARAALKLSEANHERRKQLKDKGFISEAEMEKALSEMQQLKADLEIAVQQLEKTLIKAPFEGTLSARKVTPGTHINPHDPLVSLHDLDPIRFTFQAPSKDLSFLKTNIPVVVKVDAYTDKTFEGKLDVVEPRIDDKTRNITVIAELKNPEDLLKPGLFGRISVPSEEAHQGLFIPESCLVMRKDGTYVFTIDDKGMAHFMPVTLGVRGNDKVEIKNGLKVGDKVVVAGQDKLKDLTEVKVQGGAAAQKDAQ
jgi:membrane fusion protein (multidrug efflux system)